ncbi:MAG TPA: Gfo/Idh/MocA family oxidoreductase [Chryseolinea sp.]|nr:Gfo/Idh/MocA family oxidoreductase [Chryseolinea sp.]HPH47037.1 Gfo/Idh/MocA family oxidoreductase [Chryseolinea sp.]HPM29818.1 Gfo/Idh/MocA family oxidoreductase [Chryseolinea sp.]
MNRRDFISKVGIGSTLLTLPTLTTQNAFGATQQKKLGVALVGLGYYAEFKLATALQETTNCYLAGIVTGTPAKKEKWKQQFNIPEENCYTYETFDSIINNKSIDIVYVVLPNSMHHEYVIRAAKAGKHVITEKPMGMSAKECQEMIAACKKANVKLSVGYRLHFEPYNLEAARVGQKQEFGKVKVVETSMGFKIGDPTQWRLKKALAGGGAMMDVGIYAIQGARYSTGEEPVSVTAQEFKTDPVKFKEVDETILWQMEFPSGIVSNCMTSYATHMERLFISAESGWLELRPAFGYGPLAGKTSKGVLDFPQVNHQAKQMEDFAKCVAENRESSVSGEEGLKDAKVIEAIYKAIKTKGKVMV